MFLKSKKKKRKKKTYLRFQVVPKCEKVYKEEFIKKKRRLYTEWIGSLKFKTPIHYIF
jgi:RNase P/RNase MRP subunit POP5